jgi:hypothetical protein
MGGQGIRDLEGFLRIRAGQIERGKIFMICSICRKPRRQLERLQHWPADVAGVCTICFRDVDAWARSHGWGHNIYPALLQIIRILEGKGVEIKP